MRFGLIFFGIGNGGEAIGISNLWSNGGFFTGGFSGFFFALSLVVGAYQGVELIGITAGEAKDPKKTLTRAIQSTIWRILIFYIGAIFVIVTVYPWDQLSTIGSPFVATLRRLVLRQQLDLLTSSLSQQQCLVVIVVFIVLVVCYIH